jgi:hypothetical protein
MILVRLLVRAKRESTALPLSMRRGSDLEADAAAARSCLRTRLSGLGVASAAF